MNKVKVLIEGYAREGKDGVYRATCSTILMKSNEKRILVDPGANSEALRKALVTENLEPANIDAIYLTHYHPDHFLNLRFFTNTPVYDGQLIWSSDKEVQHWGKIFDTEIEIMETPGHAPEHTSLILETEEMGTVCVAQDVFWWEDGKQKSDNYEDLMNLVDPFVSDEAALKESRQKVLDRADWIIPGHGKMFNNPLRN